MRNTKRGFMVAVGCCAALSALGTAACGGKGGGPFGSGDAIMLSENVRLSWSGSDWTADAPGATANCILGTSSLTDLFQVTSDGSLVFDGVSNWTSEEGLSPITFESSLQTATATYNGTNYTISGLVGSAVWGASDSFTVTSGTTTLSVPAPDPIADPTTVLGTPDGLSTTVSFPDGHCDAVTVFISAGMTGGAMRNIPESDIPLEGGDRVMPIADPETANALDAEGLVPSIIYVSCMNEVETDVFFPGMREVPVQAGRMFNVSYADL